MTKSAETFQFQAETKQLLDIVIHSLYSKKEIFLRELISNASDALDRVRLEALTDHDLLAADETLEIRLETDSNTRTLSIANTTYISVELSLLLDQALQTNHAHIILDSSARVEDCDLTCYEPRPTKVT